MSTIIPLRIWNQEKTKLSLVHGVYIFCWDPKWNRNASSPSGLLQMFLKYYKLNDLSINVIKLYNINVK